MRIDLRQIVYESTKCMDFYVFCRKSAAVSGQCHNSHVAEHVPMAEQWSCFLNYRFKIVQIAKSMILKAFVLVGVCFLVPSIALSQGAVVAVHGDWQLSCETPPGAQNEQCGIIQRVTAEDQANVALNVIVLKTADLQAHILRIYAPLGVLLPNGLGLNIDGEDLGRVAFVRCLPNGCIAEVIADGDLLDRLSTGQQALFIVFKTPEEGIGIPVSLSGFKAGLDALP